MMFKHIKTKDIKFLDILLSYNNLKAVSSKYLVLLLYSLLTIYSN